MAVDKFRPVFDSGYLSSPNSTEFENRKFSFENKPRNMENIQGSSSSNKRNSSRDAEIGNIGNPMNLNLEGSAIYRRRQRSFSDPLPCSTKSLSSLNQRRFSFIRNDFSSGSYNRSVQTCSYCSFHNGTVSCSICIHDALRGFAQATLRPIAIITPFKQANLLNSTIAASHIRPRQIVISDIAHRLRSISDDIDQRYGALAIGANADVGLMGVFWGFLQDLVAAFAHLVGR